MQYGISVDGVTYDLAIGVKRTSRVISSDISGMMMDLSYYNDVIATFVDYDITVAVPLGKESDYASFYEAITDPVSSHTFIFPYNNTTVTVDARVAITSDEHVRSVSSTAVLWRRTTFTVLGNTPIKTPDDIVEGQESGQE